MPTALQEHRLNGIHWGLMAVVTGAVCVSVWQMITAGWPLPHLDSVLFWQVASHIADGEGFDFSNYTRLFYARAEANWQFDVHGQLFGPLLALLSPSGAYLDLLRGAATLAVLTLLLATATAWIVARDAKLQGFGCVLVVLLTALGSSWISVSLLGRPEQAVPLVVLLGLLFRRAFPGVSSSWSQGIEIGLIAAISPLPGVIAGVLYGYFAALDHSPKTALVEIAKRAGLALATWTLVVLLVSPFSPWEVLSNTVAQFFSANAGGWMSRKYVAWELTLDPRKPGLILAWALCALAVLWQLRERSGWARVALLLGAAMVLMVVYKTSLERTLTYNFLGLAVIALERAGTVAATLSSASLRRAAVLMLTLAAALPGWGLVTALRDFPSYLRSGATLAQAQQALAPALVALSPQQRVLVSEVSLPPMFLLEANPNQLLSVTDTAAEHIDRAEKTFAIDADFFLLSAAPEMRYMIPPSGYREVLHFPAGCITVQTCPNIGYSFTLLQKHLAAPASAASNSAAVSAD